MCVWVYIIGFFFGIAHIIDLLSIIPIIIVNIQLLIFQLLRHGGRGARKLTHTMAIIPTAFLPRSSASGYSASSTSRGPRLVLLQPRGGGDLPNPSGTLPLEYDPDKTTQEPPSSDTDSPAPWFMQEDLSGPVPVPSKC